MSWLSVVISVLKLLASLIEFANSRKLIKAGEDKVVAQQAIRILEATQTGKRIRNQIKALSDEEANRLWDDIVS